MTRTARRPGEDGEATLVREERASPRPATCAARSSTADGDGRARGPRRGGRRSRPARRPGDARRSLQRHVVAYLDALFGSDDPATPTDRWAGARFAGVALAVGLLLVLRRPDALLNPQFWAEDGAVYFRENLLLGFWRSLGNFYTGFPYLLHRLVAQAATPFSFTHAPLVYNVSALLAASLSLASFSLPHFRHLVRSDRLRVLFCLTLAALPDAHELVGILANVQWYLGLGAIFISLMQLPRSRWGLALVLLAYGLCVFSSPIAIIATPLWLLRLLRAALLRGLRAQLAAALCVLGLVVAVYVVSQRNLGANSAMRFEPTAFWNLVVGRVVTQATIGIRGTLGLGRAYGFPAFYYLTALATVALVGLSVAARYRNLPVVLVCAYFLTGSIAITLLGRSEWNDHGLRVETLFPLDKGQWRGGGGRYFVVGLAMVYLAVFATVDRLRPGARKTALTAALLVGLGVALAPTFRIAPLVDRQWEDHAARLATKVATGSREPLVIPINPDGWAIPFDNTAVLPVPAVPRQALLGEIAQDQEVAQSFRSECAHLSRVDLLVATAARTHQHPVRIRLHDATTDQVVAARTVAGTALRDNDWVTLRFAPVPYSQGKGYRVSLRSPESRPGEAVSIWRSATDAYAGGEALLNGQPVTADLVFRYWCGE